LTTRTRICWRFSMPSKSPFHGCWTKNASERSRFAADSAPIATRAIESPIVTSRATAPRAVLGGLSIIAPPREVEAGTSAARDLRLEIHAIDRPVHHRNLRQLAAVIDADLRLDDRLELLVHGEDQLAVCFLFGR